MERLALLFLRVLQVNKAYVAQICQGKALSILDGCTVGMADARTRTSGTVFAACNQQNACSQADNDSQSFHKIELFLGEHAVVNLFESLSTSGVLYPKVAD